jgi:hypothetical protein
LSSGPTLGEGSLRPTGTTVFVSDPTAEAERVAHALRASGYVVVDVPLSMLVARVAVQHPRVILVDADGEGALDVVQRMRELPDADAIDVLFVARPGGAIGSQEEALAHEGSGLFVRPVDVPALVRKVEALTGGAEEPDDGSRTSTPPPSIPTSASKRPSVPPSLPPASMRLPGGLPPAPDSRGPPSHTPRSGVPRASKYPSEPPTSASAGVKRIAGLAAPVSPELQKLLSDAEQRVQGGGESPESVVPSPEEEIEAVLPAELLASLDEPLEEDEDDDDALASRAAVQPSGVREPTHDGGGPSTTGGHTTGAGSTAGITPRGTSAGRPTTNEAPLEPQPPQTHGGTHSGSTGAGISTTGGSEARERSDALGELPPPVPPPQPPGHVSVALGSMPPPTAWSPGDGPGAAAAPAGALDAGFPAVLAQGDALGVLARAIAGRTSASLCFATAEAERRVVMREGDIVTTSSTSEDESLLAFLGVRGDLPKETVRRLSTKFPPFGRHAGAALVARGYLRQDQMWPTLRAHAEWLIARVMHAGAGRLVVEAEPPGRLAAEPGVFGGSPGAAVFVEVVRRIVSPVDAVELLGGGASRVAEGPAARLLDECALAPSDAEAVRTATGRPLREVIGGAAVEDLASVLFALVQLGIVEMLRAVGGEAGADGLGADAGVAAIDADAIRERVRARMQLVEDGDYFAVLGVSRNATGYELRRAFLELRRTFDPHRLLTPEVADLADDVRKITSVLEEAYDILKDAARRERYRRAIEATPERV